MNINDLRAAMSTLGKEEHVSKLRKTVFEEFEEALISTLAEPTEAKLKHVTMRLKLLVKHQAAVWEAKKIDEREREAMIKGEEWLKSLSKKAKSAINCQLKESKI